MNQTLKVVLGPQMQWVHRCIETAALRPCSKPASETDRESAGFAGSTVADALFAPERSTHFKVSATASVPSVDFPEVPTQTAELSGRSSALIKDNFNAATPDRLSPGRSTLALNKGQVSHMLKVVADEAVRSSLKEMESLMKQASRLNLGTHHTSQMTGSRKVRWPFRASDAGFQSGFTTGNASDASGALRSDEDFASLGYVFEHSDLESQPYTHPPIGLAGSSRANLRSPADQFQVDSPGTQTIAALKDEAIAEKTKLKSQRKPRKGSSRVNGRSNHRVPRGCKIMKEAYFKG